MSNTSTISDYAGYVQDGESLLYDHLQPITYKLLSYQCKISFNLSKLILSIISYRATTNNKSLIHTYSINGYSNALKCHTVNIISDNTDKFHSIQNHISPITSLQIYGLAVNNNNNKLNNSIDLANTLYSYNLQAMLELYSSGQWLDNNAFRSNDYSTIQNNNIKRHATKFTFNNSTIKNDNVVKPIQQQHKASEQQSDIPLDINRPVTLSNNNNSNKRTTNEQQTKTTTNKTTTNFFAPKTTSNINNNDKQTTKQNKTTTTTTPSTNKTTSLMSMLNKQIDNAKTTNNNNSSNNTDSMHIDDNNDNDDNIDKTTTTKSTLKKHTTTKPSKKKQKTKHGSKKQQLQEDSDIDGNDASNSENDNDNDDELNNGNEHYIEEDEAMNDNQQQQQHQSDYNPYFQRNFDDGTRTGIDKYVQNINNNNQQQQKRSKQIEKNYMNEKGYFVNEIVTVCADCEQEQCTCNSNTPNTAIEIDVNDNETKENVKVKNEPNTQHSNKSNLTSKTDFDKTKKTASSTDSKAKPKKQQSNIASFFSKK